MTVPTPIYKPGAVLVLPFPFMDRTAEKRRPALVLSANAFNRRARHFVAAMITSTGHAAWPHDVPIRELDPAGLTHDSVVRMKLFTLDERLVLRQSGALADEDWSEVCGAFRQLFAFAEGSEGSSVHEPGGTYRKR